MNKFNNKKMNYTTNIRCNDIKPIERKFFRYMIRQLNYKAIEGSVENLRIENSILDSKSKIEYFAEKYNVSIKQLVYYLNKWDRYGFWHASIDTSDPEYPLNGYFFGIRQLIEADKDDIYSQYSSAIPLRVIRKYYEARGIKVIVK